MTKRFLAAGLLSTAAVLLASVWVLAEAPGSGGAKTPAVDPNTRKLTGEWAELVAIAKPTEEQRQMVVKISAEFDAIVAKWEHENQYNLNLLLAKRAAAQSAKDSGTAAQADQKVKELESQKEKTVLPLRAKAVSLLTADQRKMWVTHKYATALSDEYKSLTLSADQTAKMKEMIDLLAEKGLPTEIADYSSTLANLKKAFYTTLTPELKKKYDQQQKGDEAGKKK